MSDVKPTKFIKKVCLVGDPAVGKTSLVRRFVLDQYDDSYISTIGAKVMKKEVAFGIEDRNYQVSLMIWDVMGQKHFRIIESVAFEHVTGGLIVCDLTRKETLDNVDYWVKALTKISGDIPLIILANKNDLKDEAQYSAEDVKKIAENYNADSYMTSAKTGINVETTFETLARLIIKET